MIEVMSETYPEAQVVPVSFEHQVDPRLNDEFFRSNYGISLEEASQPIEAGQYRGTMGQMLTDEKCPVGAMVSEAFQEGGREAAQQKIESFKPIFPNFEPKFQPAVQLETDKKKEMSQPS